MPDTLVEPAADAEPAAVPVVVKPLLRGWSHAVSFVVVGILGLLLLALTSAARGGRLALAVYLFGLLAMFGVSAMYHRGRWSPRELAMWRRLDHSTIFLAIAGAYTPVAIAGLDGWRQTAVLVVVWSGAALGITLQWIPVHVPRFLFTAVYVVVGWSLSIALPNCSTGSAPSASHSSSAAASPTPPAPSSMRSSARTRGRRCSVTTRSSTC